MLVLDYPYIYYTYFGQYSQPNSNILVMNYVLLLTETQWIYRNLIGQETQPGHITDIAPGHDKQEIPVMCELV